MFNMSYGVHFIKDWITLLVTWAKLKSMSGCINHRFKCITKCIETVIITLCPKITQKIWASFLYVVRMTDRRFFCSSLRLTILLSETTELLRNSNGPVTPLIRRQISRCCEFRAHKEQTQSIHQAVTGILRYTDGVEIWYPACLRKGMGRDKPGNDCTRRSLSG